MAKKKTLYDLVRGHHKQLDGHLPHIYHRHGKLNHNKQRILHDGEQLLTTTEAEKYMAYGIIAASDRMVRPNPAACDSLIFALRTAISTRIMMSIGAHPEPITIGPRWTADEVYYSAIEAMRHYGTTNQGSALSIKRIIIKNRGLRRQAILLKSMIEAGIDLAMSRDAEGLEDWYNQFHFLYGTESDPNPRPPDQPQQQAEPEAEIEEEPQMPPEPPPLVLDAAWGELKEIRRCPDMKPFKPPRRVIPIWRRSEFGVFKYPWRAIPASDYQCFSVKRKKYGGTLLIDLSGSMSIQEHELEAVLKIAPYVTIAGYGGFENEGDTRGGICIIAEDLKKGSGSYAHSYCGGHYNLIDGPALRWLVTQAEPRFWISDGCVNGKHGNTSQSLVHDAENICAKGRVTRIHSLALLIQKLS